MILLDGKVVAAAVRVETEGKVSKVKSQLGRSPKLVVVWVGENAASKLYVEKKATTAKEMGILAETLHFQAGASVGEVRAAIQALNKNPSVDGILIQRPLPASFREEEVAYWVDPSKDVDCFHPENLGRLVLGLDGLQSCTPAGVIRILDFYKIPIAGKKVCIVGRSPIVGKPLAALVLNRDATLLQAHSKTPDLAAITSQADILISAVGRAGLITAKHVKPGAAVIDVGTNRLASGKLTGDVDFEAVKSVASAMTPVPGGVGPMTIAMLLANTVDAALKRRE